MSEIKKVRIKREKKEPTAEEKKAMLVETITASKGELDELEKETKILEFEFQQIKNMTNIPSILEIVEDEIVQCQEDLDAGKADLKQMEDELSKF